MMPPKANSETIKMRTREDLELTQRLLNFRLQNWESPDQINKLTAALTTVARAINELGRAETSTKKQ